MPQDPTARSSQTFQILRATISSPGGVFHDYGQGKSVLDGILLRTSDGREPGGRWYNVLPEAGTNTLFFEHEVNVGHVYVISPEDGQPTPFSGRPLRQPDSQPER